MTVPTSGPIDLDGCYESLFFNDYKRPGSIYENAVLDTRSIRDIIHKKGGSVNMSDLYGAAAGCHPWNASTIGADRKPGTHFVEEVQLSGGVNAVHGYHATPQTSAQYYPDPAQIPSSQFNDSYAAEITGPGGGQFRSAINQNMCFYFEKINNEYAINIEILVRAVAGSSHTDSAEGIWLVLVGYSDWWGQGDEQVSLSERISMPGPDTGWFRLARKVGMSVYRPYINLSLQAVNSPSSVAYARNFARISELSVTLNDKVTRS